MNILSDLQIEQYTSFRECFLEYPQLTEIYNVFDRMVLNSSLGGEQESLLLTGDTGVGKTAMIDNYVARFATKGSRWAEMPVLKTRIPSKVREQNTLERLLIDLDSRASSRRRRPYKEGALEQGVVKSLIEKKVKLVIVNEVQELMEFKDANERQTIANTFKMISEEAQVSFVLVGMPYATMLAEEDQWNSRLGWKRHLSYFHLSKLSEADKKGYIPDAEGKRHFASFVAGLAGRMGFEKRPNLTGDEILLPLFSVCRGECRVLKHFLADALLNALQSSKDTIDKPLLSACFDTKYPYAKQNPFECKLTELKLVELKTETSYNKGAQFKEDRLIGRSFTDLLPVDMLLSKTPLKAQ
ncbi:TniB family NTP-binding protein [Vibrio sp. 1F279]|uniref:TniB family NTP-binding protein n=1 Tax=unclassified Vibrio TaxID=2614977 RepID=UPI00352C19CE